MTTERAKAELEQIYGILSSEKQQALDVAFKALEREKVGHWVKEKDTLECPLCGAKGESIKDDYCFNYCPVCGARMESEHETDN